MTGITGLQKNLLADQRCQPLSSKRHKKTEMRLTASRFVNHVLLLPVDTSTGDRGRTDTPLLELDFESSASANSATPA